MKKQLMIAGCLLGFLGGTLPQMAAPTPAHARSGWTQMNRIPDLLGLSKGDWIRTEGLAKGKMQFSQLSGSHLQMEQEILLNSFARKAIEQLIEGKLSSPSNNVQFRFQVKETKKGEFEYSLFDKGNNKLLIKGPVSINQGKSTSSYQEVEFKAILAKMTVEFRPEGNRLNGSARFHVGPIPVPGKLTFMKLSS